MNEIRVNAIRDFGDRVALYIQEQDAGFWRSMHLTHRYSDFRVALIKACHSEEKAGRPPLITFDDFITIFEHAENLEYSDWRLARDLTLIRVIERLHALDWFKNHQDALQVDLAPEDTMAANPAAN